MKIKKNILTLDSERVELVMQKYTIEELLELKPEEVQPVNFDAVEFKALVEKVKQLQAVREEEFHNHNHHHGHFNRRRSSHHHGRPKVNKHKPKVVVDEEGWATFEPKNTSAVVEEGEEGEVNSNGDKKNRSTESLAQEKVKMKPNNKNISSSRPADNRDIIIDKQIHDFNTFAALGDGDDEEEEEEGA